MNTQKKAVAWAVMAGICLALTGCAGIEIPATLPDAMRDLPLEAKKFPEIELKLAGTRVFRAKFTRLENGRAAYLPFPYWDKEQKTAALTDIESIKDLTQKDYSGRAFAGTIALSIVYFGLQCLKYDKYKEDLSTDLPTLPLTGFFLGAPLGLLAGGIAKSLNYPTEYNLVKKSAAQIDAIIRHLMGI